MYTVKSTHPSSNGSYFLNFNGRYGILVFYCPRQGRQSYYDSHNMGTRERENCFIHEDICYGLMGHGVSKMK